MAVILSDETVKKVLDKLEPDIKLYRYPVVTSILFNEIAELLQSPRRLGETRDREFLDERERSLEIRGGVEIVNKRTVQED